MSKCRPHVGLPAIGIAGLRVRPRVLCSTVSGALKPLAAMAIRRACGPVGHWSSHLPSLHLLLAQPRFSRRSQVFGGHRVALFPHGGGSRTPPDAPPRGCREGRRVTIDSSPHIALTRVFPPLDDPWSGLKTWRRSAPGEWARPPRRLCARAGRSKAWLRNKCCSPAASPRAHTSFYRHAAHC